MNHLKKLKEITGKEYIYQRKHTVINDYEIDEDGLHLKVTQEGSATELLVPSEHAHEFFSDLLPVESSSGKSLERSTSSSTLVFHSQQHQLGKMREHLMKINEELMIDSSKEKLARAKALNNNINTLINSLKLEFQVTKEIRKQSA